MEYGFPPDPPWQLGRGTPGLLLGWLNVLLLVALLVLSAFKLHRESRRVPRPLDQWIWFGIILGSLLVALLPRWLIWKEHWLPARSPFPHWTDVVLVCTGLTCLIGVMGLSDVDHRLSQRNETSLSRLVLGAVGVASVLLCVTLMLRPRPLTVRPAARSSQCRNNMKVLGRAFAEYVQRHGTFPQAAPGQPAVSWRVSFLPFVDAHMLFEQYDQSSDWDDRVNLPVARRVLPGYRCPSNIYDRDPKDRYYCDYVMVTGTGTVAPGDRSVRPAEITDGAAKTLLAVEASGLNVVWTEPRDFDVAGEPIGINLGGTGHNDSPGMLSSYHAYGAHALLADGSARFIPETIDPHVLRAMTTIAAGDDVPYEW